jgi:prepilin-type N-terminal cleavage/methylation domain-containing protein
VPDLRTRRIPGDDRGLSLVELLVVMVIFSGLITAVYSVLIIVQSQTADTIKRADAVDQARLGLQQIDRQVRSGNVLYDPAAETLAMSMRVYTQANGDQKCVQWQVVSSTLRTRSWVGTGVAYSNVSAWAVVARNIVNTDVAGQRPFVLSGSATPYGARLINFLLLVKTPGSGGQAVAVETSLAGRNTQYGYDPGTCDPIPPA